MTPLESWSAERLLQPLSVEAFRAVLARRELQLLRDGHDDRLASLFNWATLRDRIGTGSWRAEDVQVTRDASEVPRPFFSEGPVVDPERLFALIENGHSLVVRRIHRLIPELRHLADDLQIALRERVAIALITTAGRGGALPVHFDPFDVLVVQLEGTKRWQILDHPTANPVLGMQYEAKGLEHKPVFEVSLVPGNVLFVPAGHPHSCQNHEQRSMHLAVLFAPPCQQNVLRATARLLMSDEECRRPVGREVSAESRALAYERLKNQLLARIEASSPEQLIDDYLAGTPTDSY